MIGAKCELALEAKNIQIEDLKELAVRKTKYIEELERQRETAYEQLEEKPPFLPWYGWVVIGAGVGALISVRALR